jgi:hypothetical protein
MIEKRTTNPLESLHDCLVFSSTDWGSCSNYAWIYGIVCGWDDESLKEFQKQFKWNDEAINRLKELRRNFEELQKISKDKFVKVYEVERKAY